MVLYVETLEGYGDPTTIGDNNSPLTDTGVWVVPGEVRGLKGSCAGDEGTATFWSK